MFVNKELSRWQISNNGLTPLVLNKKVSKKVKKKKITKKYNTKIFNKIILKKKNDYTDKTLQK